MSKGSVYFVNSQNLDKLYARVTVTRSAVTAISYMQHTRLYASTCEENKLTIWSLDAGKNSAGLGSARERKLTTLYQIKLFRPVRHLSYMPAKRDSVIDANISGDRFMFSYDSGEFDIFEVETYGPQVHEKRVHLVETDKSREHEASLTAIDFHKNLNFMVTACQGGQVKIWSTNNVKGLGDKQLIREINFPNKVDTVCFMNEHGDILVGHDRRLSVIKFQAYWPFRDERGKLEANAAIESRETP
jgi:WD40 repeat protein